MARVDGFNYQPYGSVPAGIESISAFSDTTEYSGVKGFIVDVGGTLAVEMEDGSSATMTVTAGVQYAAAVKKFKSTGTSGPTSAVAFY